MIRKLIPPEFHKIVLYTIQGVVYEKSEREQLKKYE